MRLIRKGLHAVLPVRGLRQPDLAKRAPSSFSGIRHSRYPQTLINWHALASVPPEPEDLMSRLEPADTQDPKIDSLLGDLGTLIREARQKVLRTVDTIQVQTCWQIGRHIVEFEQQGARRAGYGKQLLATLAKELTADFGKGFDSSNLRYMRLFYQAFPIRDALRHELSWTHYRKLLGIESEPARQWYMNEAAAQNWSSRALDRQINTLYYERLLMSRDKTDVYAEAATNIAAMKSNPREFIRDPVLLEFLGLPSPGKLQESELEQALIDQLQGFLLELGKGFAFVGRQQRISAGDEDFYIDLVFYNYLLKCFVILDLKRGKLSARDVGQMDMYIRMYDDLKRSEGDGPTVGIILCAQQNESVARYTILKGNEQLFASSYKLVLPSEEELRAELNREHTLLEERLSDQPAD
ncbi:putative nuclease of restriction endonuclease-like (RecB) superfamily [Pseudomonas moraviensis]|uniref:Putative nuclease of restriction endonuclease-like (RecB) superfamily n=2 Tax=Pseudomonas moraviensis TaxID=321662 RepID=A0A7Z0ATZ0_9PSED|nr:putative nuclease of restriction endonuclease-like (RecB) superfamily [Pseudomonas moraviensis]